ncbi:MAG: hypothetical protein ONB46_08490 [candidate division KSB1 bacterium]|nr:hypothetical protein [candidate division KSB1 bacterium]MDZ7365939.1 hypothetical protein [candidate division KSB1 bacterium]MDZ7403827.1 hypothetical protein [candidate division KSB1 bacterium]
MENLREKIEKTTLRVRREQMIARLSDQFTEEAEQFAERLSTTTVDLTQVRGIENIANSTDKISDITNWLKLRVGRDGKNERWAKAGIGHDLLRKLKSLESDAKRIADELKLAHAIDEDFTRQVHLRLCREFLSRLSAYFEYKKAGSPV